MTKASEKIMHSFITLIQDKELHSIKVTELCHLSQVNRSTFYANFLDVYDLADKLSDSIEEKYLHMLNLNMTLETLTHEFETLFKDVKQHNMIYTAYFKIKKDEALLFKNRELQDEGFPLAYNSIFFRTGIVSVVKLWLDHDCKEPIDDMVRLIVDKYALYITK